MKKKLYVIIVFISCPVLIFANLGLAENKKYNSLKELEADCCKRIQSKSAFVNNVFKADGWIIIIDKEIKLSRADYLKRLFRKSLNSLKPEETRSCVKLDKRCLGVALHGPMTAQQSIYFLEIDEPKTEMIGDYVFFFIMHDPKEKVIARVYEIRWHIEEVTKKGKMKHRLIWRTGLMPEVFKRYEYTPYIPYRIQHNPITSVQYIQLKIVCGEFKKIQAEVGS